MGDRLGDPLGFVFVEPLRTSGLDGAKAAAASANITEDHKGGRALAPALANVGTVGAFAYGMQSLVGNQTLYIHVV